MVVVMSYLVSYCHVTCHMHYFCKSYIHTASCKMYYSPFYYFVTTKVVLLVTRWSASVIMVGMYSKVIKGRL